MQFKRRRELKRTKIEIIPMIDTMFFLLVFFMLSSLALTRLKGIPVNLPRAVNSAKQNKLDFTVTIDKAQHVFVNREEVPLDEVGPTLVRLANGGQMEDASVVINADQAVPGSAGLPPGA